MTTKCERALSHSVFKTFSRVPLSQNKTRTRTVRYCKY